MTVNRLTAVVTVTLRADGPLHAVDLRTDEEKEAEQAYENAIHDGAWSARGRARRGEITESEAEILIQRARIQRGLRRAKTRS